jgi:4-hydroxybenzoate polyprenyltransferase
MGSLSRVRAFIDLIKFEHTVFALRFAYPGMVLAACGWPDLRTFLWNTVAMAAARTLGMGANRLTDRWIDARNPRMYAGVAAMSLLGLGLYFGVDWLQRRLCPWQFAA